MAVLDAVDDPEAVQLEGRPTEHRHALELDEAGAVLVRGVRIRHPPSVIRR
jgi:hypothetical protein